MLATSLRGICCNKICEIESENYALRHRITIAKLKRKDACQNAKLLAEENFHLENKLCELCVQIHDLKMENEDLITKQQEQI